MLSHNVTINMVGLSRDTLLGIVADSDKIMDCATAYSCDVADAITMRSGAAHVLNYYHPGWKA